MTLLEDVGVLIEIASGEVDARDTTSDESSSSDLGFHFFLCRAGFINEKKMLDSPKQKRNKNGSHLA